MKRVLVIIVIILSVLLTTAGLVYGLYWANDRQNRAICLRMEVSVDRGSAPVYLKEEDIREYLYRARISPEGAILGGINPSTIEEVLDDNPYIKKSDVYIGPDRVLYLSTKQRNPVLRVLNRGFESYYLDEDAVMMPVNPKYIVRTRFVNGNVGVKHSNGICVKSSDSASSRKILADIFTLSEYIRRDTFLDAQIEQIYITPKNEIELYPKLGGHTIVFGNIEDMESKLFRLKAVYKKGFSKTGWNAYSTINLKYKNQVVCTKI